MIHDLLRKGGNMKFKVKILSSGNIHTIEAPDEDCAMMAASLAEGNVASALNNDYNYYKWQAVIEIVRQDCEVDASELTEDEQRAIAIGMKKSGSKRKSIAQRLGISITALERLLGDGKIKLELTDDQRRMSKRIHDLRSQGMKPKEIVRVLGISTTMYYKLHNFHAA